MPCLHPDWSLAHSFTNHTPTTPGDAPQMEAWVNNLQQLLDLHQISRYGNKEYLCVCFDLFHRSPTKKDQEAARTAIFSEWTFWNILTCFPKSCFYMMLQPFVASEMVWHQSKSLAPTPFNTSAWKCFSNKLCRKVPDLIQSRNIFNLTWTNKNMVVKDKCKRFYCCV